jgi:hypothetical protein
MTDLGREAFARGGPVRHLRVLVAQSPNESIQEANVSHVANEVGLANNMPIQPAHPAWDIATHISITRKGTALWLLP